MKNIYVVVCNGISDIGKAWLTAAIAGLDPKGTLAIKIDPLLNLSFPQNLGVPIGRICAQDDVDAFIRAGRATSGEFKVSEDLETYAAVGMNVFPECNIVAGDLINRFLNSHPDDIRPGEVKKRTLNDVSQFLAAEIASIVNMRSESQEREIHTLIIEVGGTIEDPESIYVPGAVRLLASQDYLGVMPQMVLLTYFDFAESYDDDKYRVKTQYIRRGISQVGKTYNFIPLLACFARRRSIPQFVSDDVLRLDLLNVSFETQIPSERIIIDPNNRTTG